MKKLLVLALSCCISMAWAQEDAQKQTDQEKTKPAKTADSRSLDGKSFRVTLAAKADNRTSQQDAINKTGINTGTIQQGTTPSGQPIYKSETQGTATTTDRQTTTTNQGVTSNDQTVGTGVNNQNQTGTVTQQQPTATDQTIMGTEQQGTVYTRDDAQMRREDGTFKDQPVTDQTNVTQETTTPVEPVDMDKENIVITFEDGMMTTDKFNTAWEDEKDQISTTDQNRIIDNSTDENRTGNTNTLDNNKTATTPDMNNSQPVQENRSTAMQDNVMAGEPFAECPYTVTSGSGSMSTFSVRCVDGTGARGTAYWNGFINGNSISGNVVVFEADGSSSRYTFSGKAAKNPMRKATSSK